MIPSEVADASSDIAVFLIDSYRNERGVHSETVIGAAAALAGESILRAVELELPEKGWVTSERASDAVFGQPGEGGLWDYIRQGAIEAGARMDELPGAKDVAGRVMDAIGSDSFPPISVPKQHYPHEWPPNACPRLRGDLEKIFAKHKLTGLDTAQAVVLAIVLLIMKTKDVLPPAVGANLAIEIMIGVTHMAPLQEPM